MLRNTPFIIYREKILNNIPELANDASVEDVVFEAMNKDTIMK